MTKENTPTLEDQLVAKVRQWLATAGPKIHGDECARAVLKLTLYAGETYYLDDATPFLTAHAEEKLTTEDIEGWIPSDKEPSG